MDSLTIFGVQLILSLTVFGLLAKWHVAPWLARKPIRHALIVLTFPHALRHIGLAFLVPSLTAETLPGHFAFAAAYGDFVSGLLALLVLVALRRHWSWALPVAWLFNIVGTLDLANALRQAEAVPGLQTTWYIPTFFVPLLLVTHAMSFSRLFKQGLGSHSDRQGHDSRTAGLQDRMISNWKVETVQHLKSGQFPALSVPDKLAEKMLQAVPVCADSRQLHLQQPGCVTT